MSEPKVFDPGCLTISAARDAVAVACGHLDVKYVKSVTLFFDAEAKTSKAIVEFYRSHHAETALLIEEAMRTVKSLGWVEVKN